TPVAAPDVTRAPEARRAPAELGEDELLAALRAHDFGTSATAAALGISRTTLDACIARFPRIRKAKDLSRDEVAHAMAACGGDVARAAAALEVSKRALQHRLAELGL